MHNRTEHPFERIPLAKAVTEAVIEDAEKASKPSFSFEVALSTLSCRVFRKKLRRALKKIDCRNLDRCNFEIRQIGGLKFLGGAMKSHEFILM